MTRGAFGRVALFAVVAAALGAWTEPRLALVGVEARGPFQGEPVNVGRTRAIAVLRDGPPRHPATCGCARLAEGVLRPGERLPVAGASVRRPVPCGLRP